MCDLLRTAIPISEVQKCRIHLLGIMGLNLGREKNYKHYNYKTAVYKTFKFIIFPAS